MNSYSVVVVALTIHAQTIVVNFTASAVPSPELSLARGFDLHGRAMASSCIDLLIVELLLNVLSSNFLQALQPSQTSYVSDRIRNHMIVAD